MTLKLLNEVVASSTITATQITAPTISGGTAASGTLTLQSTSHATKGNIVLNSGSGNVGIGTATPNNKLDVVGDVRIHQSNNLKFGGAGASDSKVHIQYNETTKSLDFNFV